MRKRRTDAVGIRIDFEWFVCVEIELRFAGLKQSTIIDQCLARC